MIEVVGNQEYVISEEEIVVLSSETFQIQKILDDAERGERFFFVVIPNRTPMATFQTPSTIKALLARLEIAGVFLASKPLANYLTETLFRTPLPVEPLPTDVRIAVYEEFQAWVWRNEVEFENEDTLVKIERTEDITSVDILLSTIAMREFFLSARIREAQQTQILRFWRDRGWLKTQASQDHTLTVVARYRTSRGDKIMRAYRISVPITYGWGVSGIENNI